MEIVAGRNGHSVLWRQAMGRWVTGQMTRCETVPNIGHRSATRHGQQQSCNVVTKYGCLVDMCEDEEW